MPRLDEALGQRQLDANRLGCIKGEIGVLDGVPEREVRREVALEHASTFVNGVGRSDRRVEEVDDHRRVDAEGAGEAERLGSGLDEIDEPVVEHQLCPAAGTGAAEPDRPPADHVQHGRHDPMRFNRSACKHEQGASLGRADAT